MTLQESNVPSSNAGILRVVLFIIALPICIYTSTRVWIEMRTLFLKLSYKPVTEQEARDRAVEITTMLPTELLVISGSDKDKINIKAGTKVNFLGAYMERLNYRADEYHFISPVNYTPGQYFVIETDDGVFGAAILPEALIGRKIIIKDGEHKNDTMTVNGVKKNTSDNRYPYTYLVEETKDVFSWGEFTCINEKVEMIAYTCPLAKVAPERQKKFLRVPSYVPIPTHEKDGFFLFPRFKAWNMFRLKPWARSLVTVILIWIILMVLTLWIVGRRSFNIALKTNKFLNDTSLTNQEAYSKSIKYYCTRYYPWAFIAGGLFTPLVWLWTRSMNYKTDVEVIGDGYKERCPRCNRLSLKYEPTGQKTEERFVAHRTHQPRSTSKETGKVWDSGIGKYRTNTETTHYTKEHWDEYAYDEERQLYCTECDYIEKEWVKVTVTKNHRGGEASYVTEEKWV